jgi:hypothetical protein
MTVSLITLLGIKTWRYTEEKQETKKKPIHFSMEIFSEDLLEN